jgi:asparagine synthase (glutamine-hydrolysing)
MCGILGIISNRDTAMSLQQRDVVAMRDAMKARGPDDFGLLRHGRVTLAHRRLSIRDLDAGKQPLLSQDGRFAVVFNGEIYNDDEVQTELQQRGVYLKTSCDTELLVEAWSAWGQDCIAKLRGMFAFAILDLHNGEVWLVRDRCGIKPLFYAQVGTDFVFASSIAAIRKHPRFVSQPNFAAIRHYLQTLRITLDRETVYKGIYTLRPAELMRVSARQVTSRIYWKLPDSADASLPFEDAVQQLESEIKEAVKLRLKSDVPVGMMMSGGVDSNTLAMFARDQSRSTLLGVCGGGVDNSLDAQGGDFEFARQCARETGFDYSEIAVDSDHYLATWESLINHYETPVSTPTDAIIFHVARQLRQRVGVAIGGEGADEAFCGYAIPHWSGYDFDRSGELSIFDATKAGEIRESLVRQYGRFQFTSASDHYLSTNGLIPRAAQRALFQPRYWNEADADGLTETYYDRLFADQCGVSMAEKYARVLFHSNLESLLGRLDSATMATGLEARVPYTDHRIVEQAFKLPHRFKIDCNPAETRPWLSSRDLDARGSLRSKRVLRAVASRVLSPQLASRPKMSFPTPLATWLKDHWRTWIAETLSNSPFAHEVFRPDALRELNRLPASLVMWNWPVLNTVLWGDRVFCG